MTPELERLIEAAKARPPMSEAEYAEQRASFVRGQLAFGSDADEAAYRASLAAPAPRE